MHHVQVDESLKVLEQGEDASLLAQYADPLRDMTLIRLLKQVSQVRVTSIKSITHIVMPGLPVCQHEEVAQPRQVLQSPPAGEADRGVRQEQRHAGDELVDQPMVMSMGTVISVVNIN